jgi:hypothetical protein
MSDHAEPHAMSPYRAREMQILARWIAAGVSGSVVGLVGCGRSSFLRHVCDNPQQLAQFLPANSPPIVIIAIDLYDLPTNNLVDLYRSILHAFYWVRERLPAPFAQLVNDIYLEYRAIVDPFLVQKALHEVLLAFQNARQPVVMVMNRFDTFCETSTSQQVNTLRSLRDRFKETLSYIVGMRQEVIYLADPARLGDMYELFDSQICHIGALSVADSHAALTAMFHASEVPSAEEQQSIIRISGGFPSLLKAVAQWWQFHPQRPAAITDWAEALMRDATIQYRLERLWRGLTQEEQQLLSELHKQEFLKRDARQNQILSQQSPLLVQRLMAKGCCQVATKGFRINGELLAAYVAQHAGRVRGRIWLNETEHVIYQGQQALIDLTPLEFNILAFLIANPGVRHSSDTIIERAWPDQENKEVVTPNNLQVHIANLRKKVEPQPNAPRYILTWNGKPGGYTCFPEGKPR